MDSILWLPSEKTSFKTSWIYCSLYSVASKYNMLAFFSLFHLFVSCYSGLQQNHSLVSSISAFFSSSMLSWPVFIDLAACCCRTCESELLFFDWFGAKARVLLPCELELKAVYEVERVGNGLYPTVTLLLASLERILVVNLSTRSFKSAPFSASLMAFRARIAAVPTWGHIPLSFLEKRCTMLVWPLDAPMLA